MSRVAVNTVLGLGRALQYNIPVSAESTYSIGQLIRKWNLFEQEMMALRESKVQPLKWSPPSQVRINQVASLPKQETQSLIQTLSDRASNNSNNAAIETRDNVRNFEKDENSSFEVGSKVNEYHYQKQPDRPVLKLERHSQAKPQTLYVITKQYPNASRPEAALEQGNKGEPEITPELKMANRNYDQISTVPSENNQKMSSFTIYKNRSKEKTVDSMPLKDEFSTDNQQDDPWKTASNEQNQRVKPTFIEPTYTICIKRKMDSINSSPKFKPDVPIRTI